MWTKKHKFLKIPLRKTVFSKYLKGPKLKELWYVKVLWNYSREVFNNCCLCGNVAYVDSKTTKRKVVLFRYILINRCLEKYSTNLWQLQLRDGENAQNGIAIIITSILFI